MLYTKFPYEAKYQLLISKRERTGLKYLNDPKAFIEYSNDMDDIYKIIEEYKPNMKRKILMVFFCNKKLNPIVTELFVRGGQLNIYLVFIAQSTFSIPTNIRLNSTHCFVMKVSNKRELQQITFNHS